jgi:endonuclease/exonuclease/phosphatase family metal-dependent hydrolase
MTTASPMTRMSRAEQPRLHGLPLLRARIRDAAVPAARPSNLRLATWNIREFGKTARHDASISIIATLLASFDLISIVELRADLHDLVRVLRALGPHWRVVYSDYLRDAGGNHERNAFVFDTRRVTFTGLASTAASPRVRNQDEYQTALSWWRPPFLASFAARQAPFDFMLLTAHVRWGNQAKARNAEVQALGDWILARASEPHFGDADILVVGDFNVQKQVGGTLAVLESRGLVMAPGLEQHVRTDLAQGKRYDQIMSVQHHANTCFSGRAGSVDFYQGDQRILRSGGGMTKPQFTRQISDHLPLWAEVVTRRAGARRRGA